MLLVRSKTQDPRALLGYTRLVDYAVQTRPIPEAEVALLREVGRTNSLPEWILPWQRRLAAVR